MIPGRAVPVLWCVARADRMSSGSARGPAAAVVTLVERGVVGHPRIPLGPRVGAAVGVALVVRSSATSPPLAVARSNGFSGAVAALVGLAPSLGRGSLPPPRRGRSRAAGAQVGLAPPWSRW
ncbi:hypothetical protein DSY14_11135 [Nocardiopsis sp. MG754419]|nr:hypothetical protein [Nocardiopsis sp. MG754419]